MMQETNLSEKNAFCRFSMGTCLTAFGIAKVSRNPNCMKGRLMIAFGAMKMAEGIFKYCPTKALLCSSMEGAMNNNSNNSNSSNSNSSMQSMFSGQNSMSSEQIDKLMKDFSSAISGNTSGSNATASKQSDSSTSNQNSSETKNSTNKAQNPS
ncbi:hypothetical protein ACQKMV_17700 [Lysinibacillus sp. NPDC094403]|uniref:hypothetical protein n=1 Tax=Lysinibacillus sp. NPDC094403 TaxID=3390581 RepID=UPI003D03C349